MKLDDYWQKWCQRKENEAYQNRQRTPPPPPPMDEEPAQAEAAEKATSEADYDYDHTESEVGDIDAATWLEQGQEHARETAQAAREIPMADTEQPLLWDSATVEDQTIEPAIDHPHPLAYIDLQSWDEIKN